MVEEIDIGLVVPNNDQPRKRFDERQLEELQDSIMKHGIIQPILVKKTGESFEIIAGERRWRAAMSLKLKSIPAIVKDVSLNKQMEISLIENIQRENLNAVEEARFYKQYINLTGSTQEELSDVVSKSRSYVSNTMRLLKLPETILDSIASGEISAGHGRSLLALESESLQLELFDKLKTKKLSVRELEKLISDLKKQKNIKPEKDLYIVEIEKTVSEKIGKKVSIKDGKNKGKLEIEYYNYDELEDIISLLSRKS